MARYIIQRLLIRSESCIVRLVLLRSNYLSDLCGSPLYGCNRYTSNGHNHSFWCAISLCARPRLNFLQLGTSLSREISGTSSSFERDSGKDLRCTSLQYTYDICFCVILCVVCLLLWDCLMSVLIIMCIVTIFACSDVSSQLRLLCLVPFGCIIA